MTLPNGALSAMTLNELERWIHWLATNNAKGAITEWGTPSTDELFPEWADLQEEWLKRCTEAGIWTIAWNAGENTKSTPTNIKETFDVQVYGPANGTYGQQITVARMNAQKIENWAQIGAALATPVYHGVNMRGGESSISLHDDKSQFSNVRKGTYGRGQLWNYQTAESWDFVAARNPKITIARIPFRWEHIQPSLNDPLDPAELARLHQQVDYANARGIKVLLDLHNQASYYFDTLVESGTVTTVGTTREVIDTSKSWDLHEYVPGLRTPAISPVPGYYGFYVKPTSGAQNGVGRVIDAVSIPTKLTIGDAAWTSALLVGDTYEIRTGQRRVIGDGYLTEAHLQNVWERLRLEFDSDPGVIALGLMNEPRLGEDVDAGGKVTSATTTTITDTSRTWTINQFRNIRVSINGEVREIGSNTATSLTLKTALSSAPSVGALFKIGNSIKTRWEWAKDWEGITQRLVTSLRGAGCTKQLWIPGYGVSALTDWFRDHPVSWISDPANNFRYDAHQYWYRRTDGRYNILDQYPGYQQPYGHHEGVAQIYTNRPNALAAGRKLTPRLPTSGTSVEYYDDFGASGAKHPRYGAISATNIDRQSWGIRLKTTASTSISLQFGDALPGKCYDFEAEYLFRAPTHSSGFSTNATPLTLEDTTKNWTTNQWVGYKVRISGGPYSLGRSGQGSLKVITGNTATTLTIDSASPFSTTPDPSSLYQILDAAGIWFNFRRVDGNNRYYVEAQPDRLSLTRQRDNLYRTPATESGNITSSFSSGTFTMTDTTKNWEPNKYAGMLLRMGGAGGIGGGGGAGQRIVTSTSNTITVSSAYTTTYASGALYEIEPVLLTSWSGSAPTSAPFYMDTTDWTHIKVRCQARLIEVWLNGIRRLFYEVPADEFVFDPSKPRYDVQLACFQTNIGQARADFKYISFKSL